jgi:hypothetical protein
MLLRQARHLVLKPVAVKHPFKEPRTSIPKLIWVSIVLEEVLALFIIAVFVF